MAAMRTPDPANYTIADEDEVDVRGQPETGTLSGADDDKFEH